MILALLGCQAPEPADVVAAEPGMSAAEGGTVTSEDGIVRLTVPPDALAADTPIAVAPASPPDGEVGPAYAFTPEGTRFSSPAALTWRFAAAPEGSVDPDGRHLFLQQIVASDVASPATVTPDGDGLRVLSPLPALGRVSLAPWPADRPIAAAEADLGGTVRYVGYPWDGAASVEIGPADAESSWTFTLFAAGNGAVAAAAADGWTASGGSFETHGSNVYLAGGTWAPAAGPRFACAGPGDGEAVLTFLASGQFPNAAPTAAIVLHESVTCEVRAETDAWLEGAGDADDLAVPGSAWTDLDTTGGSAAYRLHLDAGVTVEVCVATWDEGDAAVTYHPRYTPGFLYEDTTPGCTRLTSRDPSLDNDALVTLTGDGDVTVTAEIAE